jgi:hypothetical protein
MISVEDEIVSKGFDRNDLNTMKFIEADREIDMRKNENVSIGRNIVK